MYNRLKCKRVQRIHVQKYVAPTQEVCFYQKQSYLLNLGLLIFRTKFNKSYQVLPKP